MRSIPVIDAHMHFLDPESHDYPWLADPQLAPIRKVFSPAHLRPLLKENGVDFTVLVQTRSSLQETKDFLAIAAEHDFVAGVVGWVDLTSPRVAEDLAALKAMPEGRYLVGIRHQVHDEPDPEWLLRDDVQQGLAAVQEADLAYDLLLRPRELDAAVTLVRRFPNMRFIVDHIAKPAIAQGEIEEWSKRMAPWAEMDNVWCKLSGMVTEADWKNWQTADFQPYIARVLEWFGESRLLYGSDWPVCLLAAEYAEVKATLEETLEQAFSPLSPATRAAIFGGNAREVYQLPGIWSR